MNHWPEDQRSATGPIGRESEGLDVGLFEGVELEGWVLQISGDPRVAKQSHAGDRTQFVTACAASLPVSDTGSATAYRACRV